MKSNALILGGLVMIGFVHAQTASLPSSVKIPSMAFDQNISNVAIKYDEDKIPVVYKIDKVSIILGKTILSDLSNIFKTGIPLHDGKSYFQCYSIPKYSHQLWFITSGQNFSEPITELVIAKGNPLPSEFCPMITASSYPIFSDGIRLDLSEDLVNTAFGAPINKKGGDAIYSYQLPKSGILKIQTHIGVNGLEKIKISQSTDAPEK